MHIDSSLELRFWRRVRVGDDCWTWLGTVKRPSGYGAFHIGKLRYVAAHRFAWEITYGEIPTGLDVCHHCDNPPCVRPDHLFVGTAFDNMQDRHRKGRTRVAIGERQHAAKLSAAAVRAIRARYGRDGNTYSTLAAEYQVMPGTIVHVVKRRSWRHIIP